MFRTIKILFYKKPEIKKGQVWVFDTDNSDPFSDEAFKVKIKAFKNGWVNYLHMPEGGCFQNESMKLHYFLYCYNLEE